MRQVADIAALSITLNISQKPALFVLVSNDGAINRMGDGSGRSDAEGELFIGLTGPSVFEAIRVNVTAEMLELAGGYQDPAARGAACELKILFQFADKTGGGFAFLYGSESYGPPEDVRKLVTEAVRLTEPWYADYKKGVRAAEGGRKPPSG